VKCGYGSSKGGCNCLADGLHLILPMGYAIGKGAMRAGNVISHKMVMVSYVM